MAKNRAAYGLWLFGVIILHIFGNDFGTRVVLFASILIPAVLICLAWRASQRMEIRLEAPPEGECGKIVKISLQARGGYIKSRLFCQNMLTGEQWEGGDFSVKIEHCGLYIFTLFQPAVMDIFGLSAWKIDKNPETTMLAMPKKHDIALESGAMAVADSDEYSLQNPGSDPSETFAIREYIPGDPIKSIHWKLSSKTDKLLVRELGLPIKANVLILLETSVPENIDAKQINNMASAAYSASHKLITNGAPHRFGWLDTATLEYKSQKIETEADINELFLALLANTAKECEKTAAQTCNEAENFQIIYIDWSYAHEN